MVKQLHMLMAALPDSRRPKNVQELKDFVQRYSSIINKGLNASSPATSVGSSFSKPAAIPKTTIATTSTPSSAASPLTSLSDSARQQNQSSVTHLPPVSEFSQTTSVAEHFQASLSGLGVSSREVHPRVPVFTPPQGPPTSASTTILGGDTDITKYLQQQQQQQQQISSDTIHAPITTQFSQIAHSLATTQSSQVPSTGRQNYAVAATSTSVQPPTTTSSSTSMGIQAGIATPLPPGLTLETLGVLCRLPENDLHKLKLPALLLSAIKVWKVRQLTKPKVRQS